MIVKDLPVSELIPYEKNPRKNDNAVNAVISSIKEFGFKVPLIIDKKNVVVCGHTRLKAAIKMGLQTVPCVVADDLTPKQLKAFRLADNKASELSSWDFELLNGELESLAASGFDMSDFGFVLSDKADIDSFFEPAEAQAANDAGVLAGVDAPGNSEGDTTEEEPADDGVRTIICPHCGKAFEIDGDTEP